MIHITKDNFVWLDVTSKCKSMTRIWELSNVHELYEVCDDASDHLIENIHRIPRRINQGSRICVEVGYFPKETPQ